MYSSQPCSLYTLPSLIIVFFFFYFSTHTDVRSTINYAQKTNHFRLNQNSKSASSQPASLGHERKQKHSSNSHSHPIQPPPGSKIPLFVALKNPSDRREKSRSESPQRKLLLQDQMHQEQRSPEEDSSLFNISNISTASSSNSSYSISGVVQPLYSTDATGSVATAVERSGSMAAAVERSPSLEKQPRYYI